MIAIRTGLAVAGRPTRCALIEPTDTVGAGQPAAGSPTLTVAVV